MKNPPILANVEWSAIEQPESVEPGERYATHAGVWRMGELELRCYRLNDGTAVIHADDMHKLLGMLA